MPATIENTLVELMEHQEETFKLARRISVAFTREEVDLNGLQQNIQALLRSVAAQAEAGALVSNYAQGLEEQLELTEPDAAIGARVALERMIREANTPIAA